MGAFVQVLLVVIAVLSLALVVAPAPAAAPGARVRWRLDGVTVGLGVEGAAEVVGSRARTSGTAGIDADGDCRGEGVFVDDDLGLVASLEIDGGGYEPPREGQGGTLALSGWADVRVHGETAGPCRFSFHLFGDEGDGAEPQYAVLGLVDYPDDEVYTVWNLFDLRRNEPRP